MIALCGNFVFFDLTPNPAIPCSVTMQDISRSPPAVCLACVQQCCNFWRQICTQSCTQLQAVHAYHFPAKTSSSCVYFAALADWGDVLLPRVIWSPGVCKRKRVKRILEIVGPSRSAFMAMMHRVQKNLVAL